MDLPTALGVAVNVLSVVNGTCRFVAKTYAIYESSQGLADDDRTLKVVVTGFEGLTSAPEQQAMLKEANGFGALLDECSIVAKKLSQVLREIEARPGKYRGWESFRAALKGVWSSGRIDRWASRLHMLQLHFNVRLLAET